MVRTRKSKQEKRMKRFFIFAMILTVLLGISGMWADYSIESGQSLTLSITEIANAAEIITVQSGGELTITGLTVKHSTYGDPGFSTLVNYVVREDGGTVKAIIPGKIDDIRQWFSPPNTVAGIISHLIGDENDAYVTFGYTSTVFAGLNMDLGGGTANHLDLNLGSLAGAGTLDNIQILSATVSRSGSYRNEATFDLENTLPDLTSLAIRPLSSNNANTIGNPIITGDGKNNATILNAPSKMRWYVPVSIGTSGPEFGTVYFRHANPENSELTFETRVATSTANPSPSGGSWNNRELQLIEVMDVETENMIFNLTNLVDDGTIAGLQTNGQGYTKLNQLQGTIGTLTFTGPGSMKLNGNLPNGLASNIIFDENFTGWLEIEDEEVTSIENGRKENGRWTYYFSPVKLYRNGSLIAQFETIQAAINAASSGDKITVAAGEYVEVGQIVINKNITIIGEDRNNTIIKPAQDTGSTGSPGAWFLVLSGCEFNLSNVTLDGAGKKINEAIRSFGTGTIANNIVKNIRYSKYQGFGLFAFDSDMTFSNNTLSNIERIGFWVFGGAADCIISNNTYIGKGDGDWLDYGIEVSGGAHATITGNELYNVGWGTAGWNSAAISLTDLYGPGTSAVITGNNFHENYYAVVVGYDEGTHQDHTDITQFSGNFFTNNVVHFRDSSVRNYPLQVIANINTFNRYHIMDKYILGNGVALYVDVPKEVIKDGVTQTYSVVASNLDGLRGFKVVVKIPKADFATEPTNFAVGTGFNDMMLFDPVEHTDDDWVYSVNGSFWGGYNGLSGDDVVLFTFDAKSTVGYSNVHIPGCWIELPLDDVVLRGDHNPQNFIPCVDTYDGWVLIDDEDPNVEIVNIADYPDYDENDNPVPYIIQHDGDGMIIPEFDLKYTDDYSLDTAMYLIVPDDATAPTMPGDFSNEVGSVAGIETSINDWPLPIDTLADGTYTIYFLVVDEAGNYSIISWDFVIDNTPPAAIVWDELIPCRTTADANESIDLKWENIGAVVKNHIWVLSYGDAGTNYTHYPEYADHSEPTIEAPNPYGVSPQDGWVKFTIDPPDPLEFPYELTGLPRGYYYVTIFASDSAGNMSAVPEDPFYRESLNYWPGDVLEAYGAVNVTDMNALSLAWGGTSWNPHCDVGPSTDYARRSRPTPDGRIDFEDLMMFSMNYENTNYNWYPRNEAETDPVTITLAYQDLGGLLKVSLYLDGNDGFVTGLDIPVAFGSGLSLQNVEIGDVWPENSLLLHTNENGVVTVSCAAFGAGAVIEGNGLVASLSFAVNGHDNSMQLQRMTARGWDNSEIEIVGNPTGEVANEDLVNVIPDSSYLGSVHPNPFRGSATLQYGLKEAGSVKLGIYNTRGQLVRNLMNEGKAAGTYQITWDGSDENGVRVSSGIYLFRMETADVIKTQKAMLLK